MAMISGAAQAVHNKLKKILIVDDDSVNNYITRKVLERMAVAEEIAIAGNGLEAIKYLKANCTSSANCPELILLDINMPVMDGYEFLAALRGLHTVNLDNVTIIFLTTSTNPRDLKRSLEMGIDCFIKKPFTAGDLNEVIMKKFPYLAH